MHRCLYTRPLLQLWQPLHSLRTAVRCLTTCLVNTTSTVQYSTVQYNPNLHVEQDEEVPLTWCGVRSDRGNISFVKSYSNSKFLIRILYTEDLHFFCHSNKNKKNHVNCASLSCRDLMFNLNKRTIKTKLNITHNNRLAHTSLRLSSLKHDRNRINILSKQTTGKFHVLVNYCMFYQCIFNLGLSHIYTSQVGNVWEEKTKVG